MRKPEDGAGPGVGSGAVRDDQLAGGVNTDHIADVYEIAERAAVGALVLTDDTIRAGMFDVLRDADVRDPLRRLIASTVRRMVADHKPVDYVLVLGEVWSRAGREADSNTDHLVRHAGSAIADLMDHRVCPVPAAGVSYAREVAVQAARHEIVRAADRIAQIAPLRPGGAHPRGARSRAAQARRRVAAHRAGDRMMATPHIWTADRLMRANLPAPRWAVRGVIAEGLTLLCGPPKVGKSWLALNVAVDVARPTGDALGGIDIDHGAVLVLALEDTARRLQDRLGKMLDDDPAPPDLHIATEWPSIADGGAELLDTWLGEHPDTRVVVIDVLAKIRGRSSPGGDRYADDYAAVSALKTVADKRKVAILVVHHVRKMAASDFLEAVSGTNGLAGAADCTIVLTRPRSDTDGELKITGRDVEETEYAMTWRPEAGRWDIAGSSLAEAQAAARRAQVTANLGDRSMEIVAFVDQHPEGVKAAEVAEHLGSTPEVVRVYLSRMAASGRITRSSPGVYLPVIHVMGVTGEPEVTGAPHNGVTRITAKQACQGCGEPLDPVVAAEGRHPNCWPDDPARCSTHPDQRLGPTGKCGSCMAEQRGWPVTA